MSGNFAKFCFIRHYNVLDIQTAVFRRKEVTLNVGRNVVNTQGVCPDTHPSATSRQQSFSIQLVGPSIDCFFLTSQIWNLDTMLPMQTLSRHEGSVNCVVIHKDLLLSGSEDMEIKVCFIAVKFQKYTYLAVLRDLHLFPVFKVKPKSVTFLLFF